jgi:Zn finger protein HypA/HybF involved in hydrogenase expression
MSINLEEVTAKCAACDRQFETTRTHIGIGTCPDCGGDLYVVAGQWDDLRELVRTVARELAYSPPAIRHELIKELKRIS